MSEVPFPAHIADRIAHDRLVWVVQKALDAPPDATHTLLWMAAIGLALVAAVTAGLLIGGLAARLRQPRLAPGVGSGETSVVPGEPGAHSRRSR